MTSNIHWICVPHSLKSSSIRIVLLFTAQIVMKYLVEIKAQYIHRTSLLRTSYQQQVVFWRTTFASIQINDVMMMMMVVMMMMMIIIIMMMMMLLLLMMMTTTTTTTTMMMMMMMTMMMMIVMMMMMMMMMVMMMTMMMIMNDHHHDHDWHYRCYRYYFIKSSGNII